jgi:ATP-dependent exoDNAse (exonuclease V) beta subunit
MRKVYSPSKRSTLDRCVRQYFYEYYAASYEPPAATPQRFLFEESLSLGHARLEPGDSSAAAACKALSSAFQAAGQVLHNAIAQHWKHRDWQPEWFERTAAQRFDQIISASRTRCEQGDSSVLRLMEHHYQLPDAEEIIRSARAKLVIALGNYFRSPEVSSLVRELLAGDEFHAEDSVRGLPKIGDFIIGGRIDGWSRKGRHIRIVDWKMGSAVGDQESLQLVLYGWWATERFQGSADQVTVQRAFLGDGVAEPPLAISERLINRCRARLRQDVKRMEDLHEYGVQGYFDAFPPCRKEKVCHQCRYQGMCAAVAQST